MPNKERPSQNKLGLLIAHSPACPPDHNTTLPGRFVTLAPLAEDHAVDLFDQIKGPHHASLFDYLFDEQPKSLEELQTRFRNKAVAGDTWTFAILIHRRDAPLKAVGHLSLMRMDLPNRVIEVGNVLFAPDLQRTAAATEAHYLLARHVFMTLGFRRYEWKCNDLNMPSRRAAARLGFTYEGTFRQHMIARGRNRDTAWFSMIDEEWPGLQRTFEEWLRPENFSAEGVQLRSLEPFRPSAV